MGLSRRVYLSFFSISCITILSLFVLTIISLVFASKTPLEEDTFYEENDVNHNKVLLTVFEGISVGYLFFFFTIFCAKKRNDNNCSCFCCKIKNICCRCLFCLCASCELCELITTVWLVAIPVTASTFIGIFCTREKKDKYEDWDGPVKNGDYFEDSKKYNKDQFIVLVIKGFIIILYPFIVLFVSAIVSCIPSYCFMDKDYLDSIKREEEEENNKILEISGNNYN